MCLDFAVILGRCYRFVALASDDPVQDVPLPLGEIGDRQRSISALTMVLGTAVRQRTKDAAEE